MRRVLVLMSSLLIVVSAQQCRTTYSTWGRYLKGHVISAYNLKNIGQCLDTCKKDQQCQSINFQFRKLVCELNDADRHSHPWDYEFKDGYAYSDYPAKATRDNYTYGVVTFEKVSFKEYYMTPLWLQAHASYIDSNHIIADDQIAFLGGSLLIDALLLKVPLVAAADLTDETPLTVEITMANDASIPQSEDSDIMCGLSDGTNFIGFAMYDLWNYMHQDVAPCFGMEATSGASLNNTRELAINFPKPSEKFYPDEFVFTLKLDMSRGWCFTPHDGGFTKTAEYSKRLKLSQGLSLEVYKNHQHERVGIKYIKITITKTDGL